MDWLRSLGLAHHSSHFLEHGYEDLAICCEIVDTDLEAIGIRDGTERRTLLQAIRQLRQVYSGHNSTTNYLAQKQNAFNYALAAANNNQDYQDIEECAEIAEPFYESLSPLHLYKQYYEQQHPNLPLPKNPVQNLPRIFSAHSNPNLWNTSTAASVNVNVTPPSVKASKKGGGGGSSSAGVVVSSCGTGKIKRTSSRDQVRLDRVSGSFFG